MCIAVTCRLMEVPAISASIVPRQMSLICHAMQPDTVCEAASSSGGDAHLVANRCSVTILICLLMFSNILMEMYVSCPLMPAQVKDCGHSKSACLR